MLAGFLLALREGVEAALIIGIVLGMLKKMNRSERAPWVWLGVGVATVVSVMAAIVLNVLNAEFEGPGEMAFEGLTMLFAAGVLTWMIFWMQKQGRQTQLRFGGRRQIGAVTRHELGPVLRGVSGRGA